MGVFGRSMTILIWSALSLLVVGIFVTSTSFVLWPDSEKGALSVIALLGAWLSMAMTAKIIIDGYPINVANYTFLLGPLFGWVGFFILKDGVIAGPISLLACLLAILAGLVTPFIWANREHVRWFHNQVSQ